MIECPPALSGPALAYARETYTHCNRYLLHQWCNPPKHIPEQEAVEVLSAIYRVIWLLLDELEMSAPGTRDQLPGDMRGFPDLLSVPSPSA